jgi:hypothetical protein
VDAGGREKNLPIIVPGWEDSTTGNIFASHVIDGNIKNVHTVRSGIEYMIVARRALHAGHEGGVDRLLPDRWRHRR